MTEMTFVKEMYTQNTGGWIMCDVLTLEDGTVLVISEEVIALYPSHDAWENHASEQLGEIYRAAIIDPSDPE